MTTHILLVEDEVKLARFIELELSSEGYKVSVAPDGMTGLTLARESSPDLAILDWMLPGLSGLELCRRLRATGNTVPVILLTAKDEVSDRVAGLDAGADDYVVKPFSIEELLARIRAHLRRTQETDEDLLQFEDLSLNPIPVNEITLSLETLTVQGIQALDPNDNYCPKQPIFQNTAQCDRSIVMQKLQWEPTSTIRKKAQN